MNNSKNEQNITKELSTHILGMLVNPIHTMDWSIKKLSKKCTYILILLLSFLYGIINVLLMQNIAKTAFKYIDTIMGNNYIFGLINKRLMYEIDNYMSWSKIFIFEIFLFFISCIIIFLTTYFIFKYVFKCDIRPLCFLQVIVSSFVPFIFYTLLQLILSYISFPLSLCAVLIGFILSIILFFKGLCGCTNVPQDKILMVVPISYVVMLIVDLAIIKVI
ncbi:YIP1 family protein [Haloimpatiens sp. FM7330]|uniref:YIP1 family protein n=1 Tax=Haloimpatiens sp. FM7330 TaxID=3298610 RepID=UPI003641CBDE